LEKKVKFAIIEEKEERKSKGESTIYEFVGGVDFVSLLSNI